MQSLALRATWAEPDPGAEPPPAGVGQVTQGEHLAWILTPSVIAPDRLHPVIVVLHGAGRQDELLLRGLKSADEADRRQAIFVVPRSRQPTWDLIAGGAGEDLAFLGLVLDSVYRRYRVDAGRQAIVGFSDGASYGLSIALSNPRIFSAVMAWAAGFLAVDTPHLSPDDPKPHVFLEYGTHDQLFPFEQVAVPMRDVLTRMAYPLEFRVDEGGIHWPRKEFMGDALDWFFGLDSGDAPS